MKLKLIKLHWPSLHQLSHSVWPKGAAQLTKGTWKRIWNNTANWKAFIDTHGNRLTTLLEMLYLLLVSEKKSKRKTVLAPIVAI